MHLIITNLRIPVEIDGEDAYQNAAALELDLEAGLVAVTRILSKSLDARDPEQFYYLLTLVAQVDDSYANKRQLPPYEEPLPKVLPAAKYPDRPIIVGFGPAGMFAALELLDRGIKPIIFERGKQIEERTVDVRRFIRERQLDVESNIQFGEGGAGSYSDGKLFSRRNNNSGPIARVLRTFIKYGAPADIDYISKPHLGTDVLCRIVRNIRNHILERGGEIRYSARMTDLLLTDGAARGVMVNGEEEYLSANIYLALGHSARDTLLMLHEKGIAMEQRPIAVGVRIEHPAATINQLRYGNKYKDFKQLGAATYSLNYTDRKIRRGVYTFCMCPGGEVINASSAQGMLVLNGMSYSRRAAAFSNAALVVTCHTADYPSSSPLAGLEFQKEIERRAFHAGGGNWGVPAQNLLAFLGRKHAPGLSENTYKQGAVAADLKEIFPRFVVEGLAMAFANWQREVPAFVGQQALLLGAETRTSSPVRLVRNERFESVNTRNLYPIGEGAGYTGGITSSAADAIRAVEIHLRSA